MGQSPDFSRALESVLSNLRKIGFRNVKPLELAALQASDDADDALRIMANVRAYFQGMWRVSSVSLPKNHSLR